jgi:pimeloyl-ACP methyl ester carboxylesterase
MATALKAVVRRVAVTLAAALGAVLTATLIAVLIDSPPQVQAAEPIARTREFIEVGRSKVFVDVSGSGKGSPIVFLHGGIHHFDNSFEYQRDDFASTRKVVGIDQRGHGHSPDDDRPFSYDAMVEDTAGVIRKLGLGPVDVVGESDGGNVGLKLAQAHPELVRRLVVSGANLRPGLPLEEVQRRLAWSPQQMAEFLPKFESRIPPSFRTDYEAVTPQGAASWSGFLAKSYRLWLTPVVISAAELKSIRAPVLVMAGDNDFSSVEDTTEIYRGLTKGQLFIVPGSGHGTFSARPQLVDLAIREFFDTP